MTSDDFIQRLRLRHPVKAGSTDAILSDIKRFLESIPSHRLQHLWDHYSSTYERDPMPRRAHMERMAKEVGIGRITSDRMAYRCKGCWTIYPIRSKGCPTCRTQQHETEMFMYSELPKKAVRVQEDCWCCQIYSEYVMGPVCKTFGKKPDSPKECHVCECRQCCNDQRMYNNEPKTFQDMAAAGKLFDPRTAKKKGKP